MKSLSRSALVLIPLAIVSGCVNSPYPAAWPESAAVSDTACAPLHGTFNNTGESSDTVEAVLAPVFFPVGINEPLMVNYELNAISTLTFEALDNGTHLVRAWVGSELYRERQLDADQLTCEAGRLVYRDVSWHMDGIAPFLPVVYRTSVDRSLTLATDESLLMENRELSAGTALVIPVGLKARFWFRFLPADAVARSQGDGSQPGGLREIAGPSRLLEPPVDALPWSGYDDAQQCLDHAIATQGKPDPRAALLLEGRDTQDFFVQSARNNPLVPMGTVVGNNWRPGTHQLRIRKLHWQVPAVADNYVICLLDKGYHWAAGDSE